ncbi:DUF4365 domain-containing protein [Kitasatospora sp. NBC_01302]|uniref:DUF4365 domain-containing protein n=1 Tax=Kitasatospora sp. NBC_01302 TaxID=2903575 RepID=UPI002E0D28DE|nr:DUF4365 domain-containing protein [Kitasatospora sp. NBC_01302]
MTRISPRRRIERAGVNALRSLLEDHDHLVQEIDGGADHGEDLYVAIVRDGRRTGHVVAVQVKSGKKYRRASGYAIPVEDHREDWTQSQIPVIGVVYDLDEGRLFWINLTKELRDGSAASWIQIPRENELSHKTICHFIASFEAFGKAPQSQTQPASTGRSDREGGLQQGARLSSGLDGGSGARSVSRPRSQALEEQQNGGAVIEPAAPARGQAMSAAVVTPPDLPRPQQGLITVKGVLGSINFDGETVTIRKDGYGPRMKGIQSLPVGEIDHVIVKPATAMFHGYIQLVVPAHPPASDRRLSTASGRPHREDPDSMSYPRRVNREIELLKMEIESAIARAKRAQNS